MGRGFFWCFWLQTFDDKSRWGLPAYSSSRTNGNQGFLVYGWGFALQNLGFRIRGSFFLVSAHGCGLAVVGELVIAAPAMVALTSSPRHRVASPTENTVMCV